MRGAFGFSARRARPAQPEFSLYHTASNLSIEKLHKLSLNNFPNFVDFAYCNLGADVV
jgi:hypothetical protein